LTARNAKPFVAVFNPDLPIDEHHLKFHGSVTKEIMKLVLDVMDGKIKKEIHKALQETIPNQINAQIAKASTIMPLSKNVSLNFQTLLNPVINNHLLTFKINADLIEANKSKPILCQPFKY